jgi:hypothetical protein
MPEITVLSSTDRTSWASLTDPPGNQPSPGREIDAFTSDDETFTCGLWERSPTRGRSSGPTTRSPTS